MPEAAGLGPIADGGMERAVAGDEPVLSVDEVVGIDPDGLGWLVLVDAGIDEEAGV